VVKDGKLKLDGENVVEFPKLPEMQQVTLKSLRWEETKIRKITKQDCLGWAMRFGETASPSNFNNTVGTLRMVKEAARLH
jgi:hypothetical protein